MNELRDLLCLTDEEGAHLRDSRPEPLASEVLAEAYRALGDPTRILVASVLAEVGELCVGDLAWVAERPQNVISHHMQILRRGGIVRARKDGKMIKYRLTEQGQALLMAGTETPDSASVRR
jgi:DNA-binding transcriptional ArsR family regulator